MQVLFESDKIVLVPEEFYEVTRLQVYQTKSYAKTISRTPTGHRLFNCLREDLPALREYPEQPVELVPFPKLDLKPMKHQIAPIQQAITFTHHGLFLEPGLGKTFSSIYVMRHLYETGQGKKFLVLAPRRVVDTWVHEFRTFGGPLKVMELNDQYSQEEKANLLELLYTLDGIVLITNYESLRKDSVVQKRIIEKGMTFDAVFMDESVKVRNTGTQNFRGVYALQPYFKRRYILTGLPTPRNVADYVGQLAQLHPVYLGFSQRTPFEKAYGEKNYLTGKYDSWRNIDWIHRRVHTVTTVLQKEDAGLGLEEPLYIKRYVRLTPEQKRRYQELSQQFVTFVESLNGAEVSAPSVLAKLCRLSQLTGGWLCGLKLLKTHELFSMDDAEWEQLPPMPFEPNPKMELLAELVETELPKPFLVVARFVHEVMAIQDMLSGMNLRVEALHGGTTNKAFKTLQDDFREGRLDAIVLQSDSGKYGLNLQRARHLVYYSNSYDFDSRGQSEARVYRIGGVGQPTIYDLLTEGTVDRTIYNSLMDKRDVAMLLLKDPKQVQLEDYATVGLQ